ncbi:hypothetical protein ABT317_35945, partial [Streptomyces carpinensis]
MSTLRVDTLLRLAAARTGPRFLIRPDPNERPYAGPRGGLVTERWLYSRRAPGNACLSGLGQDFVPDPQPELGRPGPVNPDSKGFGAVM